MINYVKSICRKINILNKCLHSFNHQSVLFEVPHAKYRSCFWTNAAEKNFLKQSKNSPRIPPLFENHYTTLPLDLSPKKVLDKKVIICKVFVLNLFLVSKFLSPNLGNPRNQFYFNKNQSFIYTLIASYSKPKNVSIRRQAVFLRLDTSFSHFQSYRLNGLFQEVKNTFLNRIRLKITLFL